MKPVTMRGLDDCLMSSVASVLEITHEDLPGLTSNHDDGSWWDLLEAALRGMGYRVVHVPNDPPFLPPGYHVGSGRAPGGPEGGHAVVCLDGRVVHDPHPSGAGVPRIERWYLIFPLEAA